MLPANLLRVAGHPVGAWATLNRAGDWCPVSDPQACRRSTRVPRQFRRIHSEWTRSRRNPRHRRRRGQLYCWAYTASLRQTFGGTAISFLRTKAGRSVEDLMPKRTGNGKCFTPRQAAPRRSPRRAGRPTWRLDLPRPGSVPLGCGLGRIWPAWPWWLQRPERPRWRLAARRS